MNQIKQIIFSGTTAECLAHFARNIEPGGEQPLIDFTKVDRGTALNWLKNDRLPKGENLLLVRYFLDSLGYQVTELKQLAVAVREVGSLIAYKKLSIGKVVSEIGFPDRDGLFRVLLGKRSTTADRLSRFRALVNSDPDAVSAKAKGAAIEAFAHGVRGLLLLAEFLASDGCTEDDRREARKQAGKETVFHLSTSLNRLCSETARRHSAEITEEPKP